jgi:hypothetical protein
LSFELTNELTSLGTTKTDKQIVRERQDRLINSLLDLLTGPEAPTPEEAYHWLVMSKNFGLSDSLDRCISIADGKEAFRRDLLCALVYDIMNRLVQ